MFDDLNMLNVLLYMWNQENISSRFSSIPEANASELSHLSRNYIRRYLQEIFKLIVIINMYIVFFQAYY